MYKNILGGTNVVGRKFGAMSRPHRCESQLQERRFENDDTGKKYVD
jgi:hypothetical protein